ncbi:CoA transferase [Streptacidiphilus griseoplanus]|uniref:CoA transferase n=1 Tax=Peterkaempfera griseoplana TaxID=66896 RepID=UPI00099EEAED
MGRNKRSAVLDGSETADREWWAELVATCDVIVVNLRPGSRRRPALDWDEVHQADPAAIVCTAQAFASGSEKGDEPAYDDVIQAGGFDLPTPWATTPPVRRPTASWARSVSSSTPRRTADPVPGLPQNLLASPGARPRDRRGSGTTAAEERAQAVVSASHRSGPKTSY